MIPSNILSMWLRMLIAVACLAGGIYLLFQWHEDTAWLVNAGPSSARQANNVISVPHSDADDRKLYAGIALLFFSMGGIILTRVRNALFLKKGTDDPHSIRTNEHYKIKRPNGSILHVEMYGPSNGIPIIFTHGWGANSNEWYYSKKYLIDRYRVIVWDLPGSGFSKKPDNNDYSLETMAKDLNAVLELAKDKPAILVGHSIGGMITLTFCRLFPEALGKQVSGLVLAHTTYINPVRTTKNGTIYTALEKPILVPLIYLTIALWPLVWAMNWLSYWNGSAHRSTKRSSFDGTETRGQLNFITSFTPRTRPDILCYGMLGMLKFNEEATLKTIRIPVKVVNAVHDPVTLPAANEKISAGIPTATITTLAPAKHMGLIEHYSEFNSIVSQFASICSKVEINRHRVNSSPVYAF
jgi:pimeloyl-ACP methyl ester carboxylesterase